MSVQTRTSVVLFHNTIEHNANLRKGVKASARSPHSANNNRACDRRGMVVSVYVYVYVYDVTCSWLFTSTSLSVSSQLSSALHYSRTLTRTWCQSGTTKATHDAASTCTILAILTLYCFWLLTVYMYLPIGLYFALYWVVVVVCSSHSLMIRKHCLHALE